MYMCIYMKYMYILLHLHVTCRCVCNTDIPWHSEITQELTLSYYVNESNLV